MPGTLRDPAKAEDFAAPETPAAALTRGDRCPISAPPGGIARLIAAFLALTSSGVVAGIENALAISDGSTAELPASGAAPTLLLAVGLGAVGLGVVVDTGWGTGLGTGLASANPIGIKTEEMHIAMTNTSLRARTDASETLLRMLLRDDFISCSRAALPLKDGAVFVFDSPADHMRPSMVRVVRQSAYHSCCPCDQRDCWDTCDTIGPFHSGSEQLEKEIKPHR